MSEKVDMTKIKKGDTVLIEAVVDVVERAMLKVKPRAFAGKPQWVGEGSIHKHIPQPVVWGVGDKFTRHGRGPWEIIFIDDSSVLLEHCGKDRYRYLHDRDYFDNWTDKGRVE